MSPELVGPNRELEQYFMSYLSIYFYCSTLALGHLIISSVEKYFNFEAREKLSKNILKVSRPRF
jgi:hypothetical protein